MSDKKEGGEIMRETYMKKENRDRRAKELKEQGFQVVRSSIRNQLLHPMYVSDYPRTLSDSEKGFGNTIYKTHFSVLYDVSTI